MFWNLHLIKACQDAVNQHKKFFFVYKSNIFKQNLIPQEYKLIFRPILPVAIFCSVLFSFIKTCKCHKNNPPKHTHSFFLVCVEIIHYIPTRHKSIKYHIVAREKRKERKNSQDCASVAVYMLISFEQWPGCTQKIIYMCNLMTSRHDLNGCGSCSTSHTQQKANAWHGNHHF